MSGYWDKVREKAAGLGKAVAAVLGHKVSEEPVVRETIIEMRNRLFKEIISSTEQELSSAFKLALRNSGISLGINAAALSVLFFKPFGNKAASWIALGLFSGALAFSIVRFVNFARKNGKTTCMIIRDITKARSIHAGIKNYVFSEYPMVKRAYEVINSVQPYVPVLEEIPQIEDVVHLFIMYFRKRMIIAISLFAIYFVGFFWILRPYLISQFGMW